MLHSSLFVCLIAAVAIARNAEKSCKHEMYRQEFPQPGMHLACIVANGDNSHNISVIKHGFDIAVNIVIPESQEDDDSIHWRAYSFDGGPLLNGSAATSEGNLIIFTNGYWIWPGVRIGFIQQAGNGYHLETLSLRPLVFSVSGFLVEDECDHIRRESLNNMHASGTVRHDHDRDKDDITWRTSTQHFMSTDDAIMKSINIRVANLTKTNVKLQESAQIVRYVGGQKYDQHYDYFNPQFYQQDASTLRMINNGQRNRLVTVLWYLTTVGVGGGGHTIFPLVNGSKIGPNYNYSDCSSQTALKVEPEKGKVIMFYNLCADGSLDEASLHGACPVTTDEGEKWVANKWIWCV